MNWQRIKALKEERGQYLADMKAILKKAEDEKRDITAEESAKFDELNGKAEQRKSDIDRYETAKALESDLGREPEQRAGREDIGTPEERADQQAKEYRQQFDKFLRTGNANELRALTVSGQGVVGDRPFQSEIVKAMKAYAGVLEAGATVITTGTGNPFGIPTADDTANKAILVAEGAASNDDEDPDVQPVQVGAFKFDSKWIKVSIELLRDAAYNVEQFISNTTAERIGRGFNDYATTGTGVAQPQGFVPAATVGKTTAATNAVTYEEFIDFQHSLDAAYRNGGKCKVQLHDLTLAAFRKLKDGDGRYIWAAGASGIPATLDGYGYVVNNSMDHVGSGAGKVIAAIGDFSRYVVRVVSMPEVIRANELFIGSGMIGFKTFQRMDGRLTDVNAVKTLKLAAA